MTLRPLFLLAALALTACDAPPPGAGKEEAAQNPIEPVQNAEAAKCWGTLDAPGAASQGAIPDAPVKTDTDEAKARTSATTRFETPCAADLTPDFTASLQRALKARKIYAGPINGVMDKRTRTAVRAFQKAGGPDTGTLSLAAARRLGLVAVELPDS